MAIKGGLTGKNFKVQKDIYGDNRVVAQPTTPSRSKPISLVKDATCQLMSGTYGPGGDPPVFTCRCKCYKDWQLQTWDEHWNQGGCGDNNSNSWYHYDWREDGTGSSTGCCTYNSAEMGRISCLDECETYCGTDAASAIGNDYASGGGMNNPITQTNLQAQPGQFVYQHNGQPYVGLYHIHQNGEYMIGAGSMGISHEIKPNEIIIPSAIGNDYTSDGGMGNIQSQDGFNYTIQFRGFGPGDMVNGWSYHLNNITNRMSSMGASSTTIQRARSDLNTHVPGFITWTGEEILHSSRVGNMSPILTSNNYLNTLDSSARSLCAGCMGDVGSCMGACAEFNGSHNNGGSDPYDPKKWKLKSVEVKIWFPIG